MRRWHRKSDNDRQRKALESKLLKAAEKGATGELKTLLEKGANAVCFGTQGTPLHYASKNGNLVATSLLLDHGAPCNIMGESNYSPLHLAARQGFTNVVSMLLKYGAKVNIETKSEKRAPLHFSAEAGHQGVVGILLDNKANVDQTDIYGITPLHNAARAGQIDVVAMLLDRKADVNKCDNYGWSSLHLAAQSGHSGVMKLLIERHSLIDSQNKYGRTPLHWACASDNMAAVELLLSHGANYSIPDLNNKTPSQCTHSSSIRHVLQIYEKSEQSKTTALKPGETTIGDLVRLEPMLSDSVERRLSEVSNELAQSGGSHGNRSRSGSLALLDAAYNPFFSDELYCDSGIEDTLLGQSCVEDLKLANHKYKSLLRIVRALMIVMQGKTESLRTQVVLALDGTSHLSYVDVIKEIYTYLQSVDDSLVDFRQELHSETSEVTRCINTFLKRCMRIVDNNIADTSKMEDVRRLHCVSSVVGRHPGTWRLLHRQLITATSQDDERTFLDKIEAMYNNDTDRAFDALYSWYLSRNESEHSLAKDILIALDKADLGNSVLMNEVKSSLAKLETTVLPETPSLHAISRHRMMREDSNMSKTVSFALPGDETESAQGS